MANPLKPIQLGTLQPNNPYINPGMLPNLQQMTGGATALIQSELGGMPSPAETRTANAAWSAGAGLPPGTPFAENRGRRLYQSEVDARKRQGLQDYLSFLRGASGTISATPGQLLNYGQRQQENTFEDALALMQQQIEQRRLDEANQAEIPYSYNLSKPDPLSLYGGYSYTRDKRGNMRFR